MKISYNKILETIYSQKSNLSFIIITLMTAMLGFVKSYVIMNKLGFYEVGLISLIQTVIEFISLTQLGFINGGYRKYFDSSDIIKKRINNTIYTYLVILLIIGIVGMIAYGIFFTEKKLTSSYELVAMIGIVVGVMSISKNWVSNVLIAENRLRLLNAISILSLLLSFVFLFFVERYGFVAAAMLIISQPIFFLMFSFLSKRSLIPTGFYFKKKIIKDFLRIGFIPFLLGIIVKLLDIIERWGIIFSLGIEDLGKYNLVLVIASFYMLLPNATLSLFFKRGMSLYKGNDFVGLTRLYRKYYLLILGYWIVTTVVLIVLLPIVVKTFIPKYIIGLHYVWYSLPYLLFFSLLGANNLQYMIKIEYKVLIQSYITGIIMFALAIFCISFYNIELQWFTLLKGASCFLIFILAFSKNSKQKFV